jgi:hypothetical protein
MPKRQRTPFQHELLQRRRDNARIEQNLEVELTIFRLAKESERNRKQLIALKQASAATLKQVIYNKHSKTTTRTLFRPQVGLPIRRRSRIRFCSQHFEDNALQPFGYLELILGLLIGFAIGFYFNFLFLY